MKRPPTGAPATACAAPKLRKASRRLPRSVRRNFETVFSHLSPQRAGRGSRAVQALSRSTLFLRKRNRFRNARPRSPVAVGLVIAVGISERNTAYDPPVVAETKMLAHQ